MNFEEFELIFWDFDGVIKDSVEVKSDSFVELFKPYGENVCRKVYNHHVMNGGMSRFEKIPLYLEWSNEKVNDKKVKQFCEKFSNLVENKVISSPWVSGVESYLRNNKYCQTFILVSATPKDELERIVNAIELTRCFTSIYGSPVSKVNAIEKSLIKHKVYKKNCLMIGDMKVDYEAAKKTGISFLLRKHELSQKAFSEYKEDSIKDFCLIGKN